MCPDRLAWHVQGNLEALHVPARNTAAGASDTHAPLRQALTAGLFLNAARRQPDGRFRVISTGADAHVHPGSALAGRKPKCIVFSEAVLTAKLYAHNASVVDAEWLPAIAPRLAHLARVSAA
jgi:Oligonucleotide/oligosaccharide-binding (OB)-fold